MASDFKVVFGWGGLDGIWVLGFDAFGFWLDFGLLVSGFAGFGLVVLRVSWFRVFLVSGFSGICW